MNEQLSPFESTVAQSLDAATEQARQKIQDPSDMQATQTADIDGQRLTVHLNNIPDMKQVEATSNPIGELNQTPEVHVATGKPISGAEVDLGLRNSNARMYQTSDGDGLHTRAEVSLPTGNYTAQEANTGVSGTWVDRPGYGRVEIKSPKARDLVAKMGDKTTDRTQLSIQAVKGKEQVQDREWYKQARRSARRVVGKDTPEAA